ncbi:uncharacterized protein TRIADDRAFT_54839 [Trichoplax adhaerens]|uniref:Uncharacterized protein n=1 Tax=Trichoplax adhaerens TaxID=10228 RepID=B3RT50_TRIAD|nr:predicted protein [Trichoplax adhaerens]EDV26635.1 predicted protein [Trichoplax adhaerens]|eukprot:XP_002110631.1 predicted protein [Trichoplax adhaerens]
MVLPSNNGLVVLVLLVASSPIGDVIALTNEDISDRKQIFNALDEQMSNHVDEMEPIDFLNLQREFDDTQEEQDSFLYGLQDKNEIEDKSEINPWCNFKETNKNMENQNNLINPKMVPTKNKVIFL